MTVLQIFRGEDFLEEIVLSRAVMGLGRHPQNDIVLDDRSLSRFHARVERRGDRFVVVDCGAQNGVHLNGERVVGESELAAGDRITLGRYIAIFDVGGAGAQRGTPPKNEVKAVPQPGQHNGKNGSVKPKVDLDLDLDVPLDDDDNTKKAKHKDLVAADKHIDRHADRKAAEKAADKAADKAAEKATRADARPPSRSEPRADKKKADPTLVLLFNGMEVSRHPVFNGLIVGRSKQSDVVISLLGLSRKHAKVTKNKEGILVEDLGSQNGTWVNNQRIEGQRKLKHGDLLNFYDYAVLYLEDGNVDVALPGADFAVPGPEADDLSNRETNRSPAAPGPSPGGLRRPATGRSPVPLADSNLSQKPPANGLQSQSELVDLGLGEGSFLGDEFDDKSSASGSDSDLSGSLLEEDPLLDDIDLSSPGTSGGTDIVEGFNLESDMKSDVKSDLADLKKDLDELEADFEGLAGTDGDVQKFEDRTSSSVGVDGAAGHAWANDDELLTALSNAPDTVMVTLEVTLAGKAYTQMPLSQTVTRVGTDARCELSLPKTSGLRPWHMTLLHLGGTVVLYRAAKSGQIILAEREVDMATLRDGDLLDLGKVRVKVRVK